ncbi:DNA sulfur modification protein DndB [Bradyrhizobium sp. SUTN9-2]|uniref:DNA sulfur modification protein DndB n=1 Tax=Bradyrhizobium sp. SUTN9-2 TaxID=1167456 RepID=UPI001304D546|nr:DNA sulfur modification protein DndB [Bradyrhizobium sp. SUTN9-2]
MLNTTQLTVRIAAVQGAFGHRLSTYSTQVGPRSLEAFLGHDPRSRLWKKLDPELNEIYSQLQRLTTADRLRGIQTYIQKRFSKLAVICGAFPAISVAVKNHLRFEPFDKGNDLAGAGTLHLDMSKSNSRIVLDGLARVSGVIELVELANSENLSVQERGDLNALLEEFSLPVVIFAPREEGRPLDMREMRQLFADFNFKQKSISPSMAIAADSSDLYIEATRRLGTGGVINANGGMELSRASLGSKSTALVVQQNLLRFVRAAAEGDTFTEAKMNVEKINGRLNESNLDSFVQSVDRYLGGMAASMGKERFSDTKNAVHLSGPGWGALGSIFYDLDVILGEQDLDGAGRKLGEIDWQRSSPFWQSVMREKVVRGTPTLTFMGGGHESRQAIRRKAHEYLGTWDRLQEVLNSEDAEVDETEAA